MVTTIKHPVLDQVKPSFVIFDIRALWRSGLSVTVPGCKKSQMTAWHRLLYSCTHMATVGINGLRIFSLGVLWVWRVWCVGECGGWDGERDWSVECDSCQGALLSTEWWTRSTLWTRRLQWCHTGGRRQTVPGTQGRTCRYLLNIWEFVCFVCGLSPPKRHVVRWRNCARTRVATICRTCAGFYVYGGRRYENSVIFLTMHLCRPRLLQRWPQVVGRLVGRPTPSGWLAGWLQQHAGPCPTTPRCQKCICIAHSRNVPMDR